MCGYVVVNATHGGFHVCDCRTNTSRLSHAEAISTKCRTKGSALAQLRQQLCAPLSLLDHYTTLDGSAFQSGWEGTRVL